ncbi:hypothetical protein CW703_00330 [Candidatus Bathyarchaeota archaeon]|nr:MAG: hypothetical protein CW703_00330 [Candidatus Bathyarchaeota archaeon]
MFPENFTDLFFTFVIGFLCLQFSIIVLRKGFNQANLLKVILGVAFLMGSIEWFSGFVYNLTEYFFLYQLYKLLSLPLTWSIVIITLLLISERHKEIFAVYIIILGLLVYLSFFTEILFPIRFPLLILMGTYILLDLVFIYLKTKNRNIIFVIISALLFIIHGLTVKFMVPQPIPYIIHLLAYPFLFLAFT